jgi:hypothetical protein
LFVLFYNKNGAILNNVENKYTMIAEIHEKKATNDNNKINANARFKNNKYKLVPTIERERRS